MRTRRKVGWPDRDKRRLQGEKHWQPGFYGYAVCGRSLDSTPGMFLTHEKWRVTCLACLRRGLMNANRQYMNDRAFSSNNKRRRSIFNGEDAGYLRRQMRKAARDSNYGRTIERHLSVTAELRPASRSTNESNPRSFVSDA